MLTRIAFALPIGAVVTVALLYSMHLAIQAGHGHSESTSPRRVDFVRIERGEVVHVEAGRPEKPDRREPAPDLAQPEVRAGFASSLAVAVAEPGVALRAEVNRIAMTASDGEYLPIVKVAPRYPVRALQRRLEGYVIVEFVVTASGSVRDVAVVESSSALFEDAAIEAALKFRYKPRVVDGTAIEVAGVQNRISFRLNV